MIHVCFWKCNGKITLREGTALAQLLGTSVYKVSNRGYAVTHRSLLYVNEFIPDELPRVFPLTHAAMPEVVEPLTILIKWRLRIRTWPTSATCSFPRVE